MSAEGDGTFEIRTEISKVDDSLGLVMGYAIVCKQDGQDYYDLQDDHIPEEAMLKAALDFMENGRVLKEMHAGEGRGTVVFAWPLTTEVAKAFDIQTNKTGLLIAVRPDSEEMLRKFQLGELTGFSIGGVRVKDEEVADA